jgi:hypothetical protein
MGLSKSFFNRALLKDPHPMPSAITYDGAKAIMDVLDDWPVWDETQKHSERDSKVRWLCSVLCEAWSEGYVDGMDKACSRVTDLMKGIKP